MSKWPNTVLDPSMRFWTLFSVCMHTRTHAHCCTHVSTAKPCWISKSVARYCVTSNECLTQCCTQHYVMHTVPCTAIVHCVGTLLCASAVCVRACISLSISYSYSYFVFKFNLFISAFNVNKCGFSIKHSLYGYCSLMICMENGALSLLLLLLHVLHLSVHSLEYAMLLVGFAP